MAAATHHFYPTYFFREKEQDPIIDALQTIKEEAGHKLEQLHVMSGLSTTTMYNWFTKRKTRKPQYCSIVAFARAHGYDVTLVKTNRKLSGRWNATAPRIITNGSGRRHA